MNIYRLRSIPILVHANLFCHYILNLSYFYFIFYFIKFLLFLIFRTAQIVPRLLAVLVSFTYSSYKTFYLLFVKTCFIRKILYNKFAWLIHYSYLGNLPNVLYKVWNYANKIVDELNHMGILWGRGCSNSHLMNLTKGGRGVCANSHIL